MRPPCVYSQWSVTWWRSLFFLKHQHLEPVQGRSGVRNSDISAMSEWMNNSGYKQDRGWKSFILDTPRFPARSTVLIVKWRSVSHSEHKNKNCTLDNFLCSVWSEGHNRWLKKKKKKKILNLIFALRYHQDFVNILRLGRPSEMSRLLKLNNTVQSASQQSFQLLDNK